MKTPPGSWILKGGMRRKLTWMVTTAAAHQTALTSPLTARDSCTTVPFSSFQRKCWDFNTPKWYLTAKERVSITQGLPQSKVEPSVSSVCWQSLLHLAPPSAIRAAVPEWDTMLSWTRRLLALATAINPQGFTHPLERSCLALCVCAVRGYSADMATAWLYLPCVC